MEEGIRRQVSTIAPGGTPGLALGRCLRLLLLLGFGNRDLDILESQLPVIFAEFLRPFAVNRVVELSDQVLEALVGLLQRVPLAEHRASASRCASGIANRSMVAVAGMAQA